MPLVNTQSSKTSLDPRFFCQIRFQLKFKLISNDRPMFRIFRSVHKPRAPICNHFWPRPSCFNLDWWDIKSSVLLLVPPPRMVYRPLAEHVRVWALPFQFWFRHGLSASYRKNLPYYRRKLPWMSAVCFRDDCPGAGDSYLWPRRPAALPELEPDCPGRLCSRCHHPRHSHHLLPPRTQHTHQRYGAGREELASGNRSLTTALLGRKIEVCKIFQCLKMADAQGKCFQLVSEYCNSSRIPQRRLCG